MSFVGFSLIFVAFVVFVGSRCGVIGGEVRPGHLPDLPGLPWAIPSSMLMANAACQNQKQQKQQK